MNPTGIVTRARSTKELTQCPQCGSTSRVGRDFCLNCLLDQGLGTDTIDGETFESALDAIEVRDADWQLGNYQILDEIGRGGMGVIYRARQRHSNRIVALKRVLSYHSESAETLARFRREAEAVASLDHPNILPIYEVGESADGLPFFSMKFAAGGSLLESLSELKREPRRCVALMAKVARAIQYAHGQGILHRDLKPGNILLDGRGEPMVSDFGLARWLDTTSDLTRTLTIFGTPGYIAPEQAHGLASNLKPTADIYSLGAILFDLFAGRPPFLGEHALAVIKQASEKDAPKLRSLVPKADKDLETICAKCLERDPATRYPSAHDLATDLERYLEGRPIIARPVSPIVQTWRWSKRNRKLAGSVAAAVILGFLGLAATLTSSRLSAIVQKAELAKRSVTVVPFEDFGDLTPSPAAHSLTDIFLAAFSQTKGIRVNPLVAETAPNDPWSAEDWKAIATASGTRLILSGSVRANEGQHRVAIHLIDGATGSVILTSLYDADYPSAVQGSVGQVLRVLNGEAAPPTPSAGSTFASEANISLVGDSNDASARSYYARGVELFFRYNLLDQKRAIEAFRKAVEIDPNYARAYAMLASAYQAYAVTDPNGKWLDQADQAIATALRIAPMLPEAHRAQATSFRLKGQSQAALDSYLTAYELDPSDARAAASIGNIYDFEGRPDLSIGWLERATRRETRPLYADDLGEAWADLGDFDKAEKAFKIAAVFRPDLSTGAIGLSKLALFRGNYESARKQCQAARERYQNNPQPLMMAAVIEFFSRHFDTADKLYAEALALDPAGGVDFPGAVRFLAARGFIKALSPAQRPQGLAMMEEARTIDEREVDGAPQNPTRLYSLAADLAALGRNDAALPALEKAVSAGWIDYHSMRLDPRFDSIRPTQAFELVITRLTEKVDAMRQRQPSEKLPFDLTKFSLPSAETK